jgi:hypothetical protein
LPGKSTLLNNLFGCDMPVSAGRTTRGENITCVNVHIPTCSIKKIRVQDFEGLMTMERGNSVFDQSVCLYALATSDLVLLNSSKIIDAPTQELLKYTMFAFHQLGLSSYRKPKLTFILRDMASSDLTEFGHTKTLIENAMLEYFIGDSTKTELTSVIEQPKYISLASALHRQDHTWYETLFPLRDHIFTNIEERSRMLPDDHKSWTAWITAASSIWTCVRKNLNLLDAGTLAELKFKEQMDKALHESIESPTTISKAKRELVQKMDTLLLSICDCTPSHVDQLEKNFLIEIQDIFQKCEEEVGKLFIDRIGVVQPSVISVFERFKIYTIVEEVQQHKDDVVRIWDKERQIKENTLLADACLKTLVTEIERQAHSQNQQPNDVNDRQFEKIWSSQEHTIVDNARKLYCNEKVSFMMKQAYGIIAKNRHKVQPNNVNDVTNMDEPDLNRLDLLKDGIIQVPPGSVEKITRMVFRWKKDWGNTYNAMTNIKNCVIKKIIELVREDTSGFQRLHSHIRNCVNKLNDAINIHNEDLALAVNVSLSLEFYKAAHRHLFRLLFKHYEEQAEITIAQTISAFTTRKSILKGNYMSAVTKTYDDVRTAKNLIHCLQDALFKYTTDPRKLSLRVQDIEYLLQHQYEDIASPRALDELCYDETFRQFSETKAFEFIKDRNAYLSKVWNERYRIGTESLSRSKIDEVLNGNYQTTETGKTKFDLLRQKVVSWFDKNKKRESVDITELLKVLKENNELRDLLTESDTFNIQGVIIDKVRVVRTSLDQYWNVEDEKKKVRKQILRYINELKTELEAISYGCKQLCPYCYTKCSQKDEHVGNHQCYAHLISGFGGCHTAETKKLSTSYCTGNSWDHPWKEAGKPDSSESYTFAQHLMKFHPEWTIEQGTEKLAPKEQRDMFEKLNKQLAKHFKIEEGWNWND